MFSALEALLKRRNQRFVCTDTGWPEPGPERHTAHLKHEVTPPLDATSLEALRTQVDAIPELSEFFSRWGSLRLYCDTISRDPVGYASAFYIAPPAAWPELRERFDDWIEDLSDEEREDLLPPWINTAVAVGEVPNSGNSFLVPLVGPNRGKVFLFDHDGYEFQEKAANFAAFINSLATADEALLWEILGHTRYSDGETSIQWLCKEYHYDPGDA